MSVVQRAVLHWQRVEEFRLGRTEKVLLLAATELSELNDTSSGLKSSGWVEPRRCFSKQLLNCLSIRTLTAEMVSLLIIIL